jgi:predicted metalloprotease with PDZ domain
MMRPCRWLPAVLYLTTFAPAGFAADAIELHLDASDAPRRLLKAHLVIPAQPGPLTLFYPKWIPGEHAPSGPVTDLAGVKITANGKPIPWKRDEVDTFAIHLTVPEGAERIEVDVEFVATPLKEGFSGGASISSRLAILSWNHVLLYPKGSVIQVTKVVPSLTLPKEWQKGCALPIQGSKGSRTIFAPTTLETLCDSPVLCGKHYAEIPIGPKLGDGPPHFLCIAADSAEALKIKPELQANYDRLVVEAGALFGARHYGSYRFLVTASDHVTHTGIEHHESSDNRVPERMFIDSNYRKTWHAWLLSHEYVHSWNGKHRRPAGMITRDFQAPQRTSMLWVYEGLTQYLGLVLAARSGLWTPEVSRDNLAHVAEWAKNQTGRDWRSLEDTAAAAQHLYFSRADGGARRRSTDFYDEGALIWLDADTLIREKTKGERSLDDFCKAFYGGKDSLPAVKGYEFEEIVATLNGVVKYDWKGFLEDRVMKAGAKPPLDGLTRAGWELTFSSTRSDGLEASETESKNIDLTASIGIVVKEDGTIADVIPLKPADKAGVAAGMKLLAVNGRRWTAELLRSAVAGTKDGKDKLELLLENADFFETLNIPYTGGEKYPHLKQTSLGNDLLSEIFRAKALPIEKK